MIKKMVGLVKKMQNELKQWVCAAIDAARPDILAWGRQIASAPELGFKETQTSCLIRRALTPLASHMNIPWRSPA